MKNLIILIISNLLTLVSFIYVLRKLYNKNKQVHIKKMKASKKRCKEWIKI